MTHELFLFYSVFIPNEETIPFFPPNCRLAADFVTSARIHAFTNARDDLERLRDRCFIGKTPRHHLRLVFEEPTL